MKKKIKTWLIHLLGGVTVEEPKNSGKGHYRIGIFFFFFLLWLPSSIMLTV